MPCLCHRPSHHHRGDSLSGKAPSRKALGLSTGLRQSAGCHSTWAKWEAPALLPGGPGKVKRGHAHALSPAPGGLHASPFSSDFLESVPAREPFRIPFPITGGPAAPLRARPPIPAHADTRSPEEAGLSSPPPQCAPVLRLPTPPLPSKSSQRFSSLFHPASVDAPHRELF